MITDVKRCKDGTTWQLWKGGYFSETVMWCHLYCVFTYIYSLLIEKDICDCWNVSVEIPCLCVAFIRRSLHFFGKSFLFSPFFCVKSRIMLWIVWTYPAKVDVFFQDVKILNTSPAGGTLSCGSRVWDFRLRKEPQAWKNRPLREI